MRKAVIQGEHAGTTRDPRDRGQLQGGTIWNRLTTEQRNGDKNAERHTLARGDHKEGGEATTRNAAHKISTAPGEGGKDPVESADH